MQKEISLHMLQLRRTSCLWMNEIKKETKWNYQIQGLMGKTGIHHCDLVIYTLKGILIVNIKFDSDLWNEMLQKLRNFFVEYIVQELFHHDILKSLQSDCHQMLIVKVKVLKQCFLSVLDQIPHDFIYLSLDTFNTCFIYHLHTLSCNHFHVTITQCAFLLSFIWPVVVANCIEQHKHLEYCLQWVAFEEGSSLVEF